ncbi:MAG: zinc ribbon domain-containing protein [Brevefilum sp.]
MPAEAESLNVFERSSDGEKIPLSYEASEDGFWEEIRFSTEARIIQIEYTDPNIVKLEDRRFYDFRWLSIYPVETLTLTARQPFGAGEIHTEPELEDTETGPDEAMYSTGKFGPISAEELFSLNLTYVKNTSNLAYPALEVEPAVPVTDATPGRTSSPLSVVMWLFTVAVAVILLVGLYYWWFKSNVMEKQDRIVQGVGIMNPEKQAVFCHECGMRSRPVDSYCSNCGTELRRPT